MIGLLAVAVKRSWFTVLAVFLIFMIGLSRIYLGVHFYIDVLTGWLIGGVVLYIFLKVEGSVENWFAGKSFGVKAGTVFAYSLLMILAGAAIIAAAGDYQMPHDWMANAHVAYPEEPIESPLNLNGSITTASALFGLAVGFFWVNEAGGYNANSGTWWQKILRFVVGVVGVLVLYVGLGQIFPDQFDFVSYLLRYVRYGLIGVWISGISPRLFIRIKLAAAGTD